MRVKKHIPTMDYVALICFTATMWRSHKQDGVLDTFETIVDASDGQVYENWNVPACDYARVFDTRLQRSDFIKQMRKQIGKHVRLVTILDVTA